MSQAIAIKPKQIHRCLKLIKLMQDPETKAAAFVLSHLAIRVSEIARIEVRNLLYPSGKIREEVHLPAKICKGLKSRTVWITNQKARQAIQDAIDYRIKRNWGTSIDSDEYQGLIPDSRFLYNNRGRYYALSDQPRKMQDGSIKVYKACDALQDMFRKLYKKCGIKGASSHTGRKSFITNAILSGRATIEQLARNVGHDDPQTTLVYVQICRLRIAKYTAITI